MRCPLKKLRVSIIGATGLVGQRLTGLLSSHPIFSLSMLCAGPRSAGRPYFECIKGRKLPALNLPKEVGERIVSLPEPEKIAENCDLVFCAVKLPPDRTRALEESLAKRELCVISLNSSCRMLEDVPVVIPEINPEHLSVLPAQRRRLKTCRGFIVAKCNCALLSFVPILTPLLKFEPQNIFLTTLQAASGAGKLLENTPHLKGNVLPYIAGEEEKCETEPLKIWGEVKGGKIVPLPRAKVRIRAQCFRVPIEEGHFASVFASFAKQPSREEVMQSLKEFNERARLKLFSAPENFLHVFSEDDRPQPLFDLFSERGMAIEAGRIACSPLGVKFVGLSHNTLRGAAGGAVLLAEYLLANGYLFEHI